MFSVTISSMNNSESFLLCNHIEERRPVLIQTKTEKLMSIFSKNQNRAESENWLPCVCNDNTHAYILGPINFNVMQMHAAMCDFFCFCFCFCLSFVEIYQVLYDSLNVVTDSYGKSFFACQMSFERKVKKKIIEFINIHTNRI